VSDEKKALNGDAVKAEQAEGTKDEEDVEGGPCGLPVKKCTIL